MLRPPPLGANTPTARVKYTAPCPTCGTESEWHTGHVNTTFAATAYLYAINCPECGPLD